MTVTTLPTPKCTMGDALDKLGLVHVPWPPAAKTRPCRSCGCETLVEPAPAPICGLCEAHTGRPHHHAVRLAARAVSPPARIGELELRSDIRRAYWRGGEVSLTVVEFQIVSCLATKLGNDVSYRQIYDLVHRPGFVAGYGDDGFKANVRSFIKRIRAKFRAIDSAFDRIENYPSYGYRWRELTGEASP